MGLNNGLLESELIMQELLRECREILILHEFIKKSRKTPRKDLDIARERVREVKNERS